MTRRMVKRRGGFIPAAALAGLVGRAAVGWAVPKALNYLTKKRKKGKGVTLPGSRGGALYMHGAKSKRGCGVALHGSKPGYGLILHGSKPGRGIKQIVQKAMRNPVVQGMVAKAKQQVKRHMNYAIDNPGQAFKNVKKMVTGSGHKKVRTLRVKQRRVPKQRVAVESSQAGGTTAITLSKHFKPNAAMKAPMSMRQIKNKI